MSTHERHEPAPLYDDDDSDLGTFIGLASGGYFFRAIAPANGGAGWRVRTFREPMSVAVFIARHVDRCLNMIAAYENGNRQLLDGQGRLVPGAAQLLLGLLSDDEVALLKLFVLKIK